MKRVHVIYRHEADSWSAESPDAPGYTAVADTLRELRRLVREGLPFFLDEPVFVEEVGFAPKLAVGDLARLTVKSRSSSVIGNLNNACNDAAAGVSIAHGRKVVV